MKELKSLQLEAKYHQNKVKEIRTKINAILQAEKHRKPNGKKCKRCATPLVGRKLKWCSDRCQYKT